MVELPRCSDWRNVEAVCAGFANLKATHSPCWYSRVVAINEFITGYSKAWVKQRKLEVPVELASVWANSDGGVELLKPWLKPSKQVQPTTRLYDDNLLLKKIEKIVTNYRVRPNRENGWDKLANLYGQTQYSFSITKCPWELRKLLKLLLYGLQKIDTAALSLFDWGCHDYLVYQPAANMDVAADGTAIGLF